MAPGGEAVAEAYGRRLSPLLASLGFSGGAGEVLRVPTGNVLRAGSAVFVGVGALDALEPSGLRRAAGLAARTLGNAASVALALPADDAASLRAVVEGFRSGGYGYSAYKSGERPAGLSDVVVLTDGARRKELVDTLSAVLTVEDLADQVRDWVNTPPNDLTPEAFAAAVVDAAKGHRGLTVDVLDVAALEELGCGGILGVGLGSANPPRLVRMHWRPRGAVARVALVGKGITYDSGGLTIKPGGSMATMKNDMAGAAAVGGVAVAAAELGLPVEVTAYLPMAENMPSGSAMRPGDVLRMYGGTTVEVRNTDAEGRLVLADALAMAVETSPDAIVEISTLTGPCVVALGDRVAGLFGDDPTTTAVAAAAEAAGEMLWRMPIPDHIARAVRSESRIADVLQHNFVRWGSASWAAAFLTQFVGDVPFAHLDVAGPAWNSGGPWGDVPAGATAYGVRTLVRYLRDVAEGATGGPAEA